jgi:eukaryotic-like serine/threonine-protein kinase
MSRTRIKQITKERWERIEAVLDVALELVGSEREAWLDRVCSGDAALRSDVERLLTAEDRAGTFLEVPQSPAEAIHRALAAATADSEARSVAEAAAIGAVFGPYRIIEPLGKGGMGAVYIAERADGEFEQRVALKVVRTDLDTDEMMQRFMRERQILARLQHPHIAALLDGGRSLDGQPWFAMELIDGQPITRYCESHNFPIDRRLHLFGMVCDAVRAAHRANVVHRDIKPSNILVNTDGYVKLLDFGISKQLADGGVDPRTSIGTRMLTPEYAAPEQLRDQPVSKQTDIYSLGTVLYEMLTGIQAHQFASSRFVEFDRIVCEVDPDPPSVVLARMARSDQAAARAATLRGALDGIVLKAMHKAPAARYASIDEFGEDIRRYRAAEPVGPEPAGRVRRLFDRFRRARPAARP